MGTDSSVVLKTSPISIPSWEHTAYSSQHRWDETEAPSQHDPALHLVCSSTNAQISDTQHRKAQGHFLPLFDKPCYSHTMWTTVKSGSNKDTKGRCPHSEWSSFQSHCEGFVSLHGAMRTEAVSLLFPPIIFHITQELYSTFCSYLALT